MENKKYDELINSTQNVIGGKGVWYNFEETAKHDKWVSKQTAIQILQLITNYIVDHSNQESSRDLNKVVDLIAEKFEIEIHDGYIK